MVIVVPSDDQYGLALLGVNLLFKIVISFRRLSILLLSLHNRRSVKNPIPRMYTVLWFNESSTHLTTMCRNQNSSYDGMIRHVLIKLLSLARP